MSKPVIILDAGQLVGLSGNNDGDVLTWNGTEWVSSPGGGVGTVTSVSLSTASTGLTVSGGTSQTITGSGTFTLGGTLGAGCGGTGLGSPAAGDAGKVLTAKADGTYELATNGSGTITNVTASSPLASSGGATPNIALTGTVDVAHGGTGLATVAQGKVLYASALNTLAAGTLSDLNWSSVTPSTSVSIFSTNGEQALLHAGAGLNLATDNGGSAYLQAGDGASGGSAAVYGGASYSASVAGGGDVAIAGGDITAGGNVESVPGGIIILSGNQFVDGATRRAGDVLIDSGTSAAGGGYVRLGTNSAALVSIGRDTVTTSINGDLYLQNALGPSYGGTGLAAPAVGDVGKLLTATASGTYELAALTGEAGTFGSASSVPVFTTNDQGRVTSVTETPIAIAQSAVSGLADALALKADKTTTISAGTGLSGGGDLSANRTISMPNVGTQGTYGSASSVAVITTDQQGRVSGATTTAIAVTQSQVSGLISALGNKADKTVQLLSGTGIDVTGAGTLAGNSTISLKSEFAGQADQGSATKTVTLTTDSYGRVTSISQQNIAGLAAGVITSGQLGIANGGTGLDASSVLAGAVLMGEVGGGALALHELSGDATMFGDGTLTVTGLQTNPVSSTVLGAPDAGKALVWSGSAWQATNIQGGGGGGGLVFYMNYAASSPYPMSTQFDEHAGWDTGAITVANDANGTALGTFVTAVGSPAIEVIPAGIWDVNFYAAASSNANSTAVRVKVATLAGATQTVIATSDWVYISDPSAVNGYSASVYVPLTDVALTDRVEIIFEGRRFVSASQTITVHFGNDSITHAHTTINAPGGTGLLKVVSGYLQSPATLLVNADVDSAAAIAVAKLASGTNSYVLTTVAGVPTWQPPAATGVTTLTGTANQVLVNGGYGTPVSGAVTLTLPQAIGTGSGPTFGTLALSTLADGVLKATNGTGFIQSGFVSLTTEVGGVLPIAKGGTNLTSSGASGNLLVSNGSAWASVAMAGDATIIASGTITLANTGSAGTYGSASAVPVFITDAKGRVTSVTNTSIDISASAITGGTLNTTRGGTGVSNPSTGTLLLGAGASAMTSLSGVTGDTIIWSGGTWTASALSSNAVTSLVAGTGISVSASTGAVTISIGQSVATTASPSFEGLSLTVTPLAVGSGGTGVSSLTSQAILIGGSTVGGLSGTASGQFARWNQTAGAWASTALTGTSNQITVTSDATSTTLSLPQDIATTSQPTFDQVTTNSRLVTNALKSRTNTAGFSYIQIDPASGGTNIVIQPTTVATPPSTYFAGGSTSSASGAAGAAYFTGGGGGSGSANGGAVYVRGGGKSPGGANGAVFLGDSSTSAVTIGATGITTTINGTVLLANALAATSGGTGQSSYAVGDLLYADTTSSLAKLADVATGNALISGGVSTAPSWGKIGLTTHVSGTLGIGNGGTGASSTSQNYVFAGPTSGSGAPGFRALVAGDISGLTPYDLSGEFVGTPATSAVIMRFVAARTFTFGGTAYFAATSNTGATAAVFTVNVNGVSKGTVSIAGNATSGTGTITSTLIAAGDLVTVVATTPASVINPYWTLPGTV